MNPSLELPGAELAAGRLARLLGLLLRITRSDGLVTAGLVVARTKPTVKQDRYNHLGNCPSSGCHRGPELGRAATGRAPGRPVMPPTLRERMPVNRASVTRGLVTTGMRRCVAAMGPASSCAERSAVMPSSSTSGGRSRLHNGQIGSSSRLQQRAHSG